MGILSIFGVKMGVLYIYNMYKRECEREEREERERERDGKGF